MYPKTSSKVIKLISDVVLNNPKTTWGKFLKKHPNVGISVHTFQRYRKEILTEAGRSDELRTHKTYTKKEKSLYTKVWNYPVADFDKDPLAGLNAFLQSLTNTSRANFELIKIEKQVEGKWVPHLEIRES